MSSAKSDILAAIRRNRPPAVELPDAPDELTTYADRQKQFLEVLEAVGGQAIVGSRENIDQQLRRLSIYTSAQVIASLVPGIGEPNLDLSQLDDPHALDIVDIAILPGEFAVAENAAVWVTDRELPLRVLYFICQHLVLVVPASEILDHMHEAYERLVGPPSRGGPASDPESTAEVPLGSRDLHTFTSPSFGCFISGPSKTADIEQSLVIGAHGPRSLTVCILEDETARIP